MGEVLSALKAVKAAKAATVGSNGADTSDPGAQLMSDPLGGAPAVQPSPLSTLYPNMPDFSGQGNQQAQGGQPAMDAPQISNQSAPQVQAPQAPADNPYDGNNYSTPQEIGASIGRGSDDDNVTVTGDAWKPKKESGLGRIMDTLLELRGRKPVFKDRTDDANLQSASENAQGDEKPGFDQQKLISRVRKFNPELANQLQDKLTTSTRLQDNLDRQNAVFDLKKEEIVRDRAASMMSAVKPTDTEGMAKMRERVIAYAKNKGYDFEQELPKDMTGFDYDSFRLGQIKMKDQEKLGQGDRRLDQRDTTISNQDRHNRAMEGIGQQNADTAVVNSNKHPDKGEPRVVDTKNGRMEVRGNRGVIRTPDGKAHLFISNDGQHWVHVNTIDEKQ